MQKGTCVLKDMSVYLLLANVTVRDMSAQEMMGIVRDYTKELERVLSVYGF